MKRTKKYIAYIKEYKIRLLAYSGETRAETEKRLEDKRRRRKEKVALQA